MKHALKGSARYRVEDGEKNFITSLSGAVSSTGQTGKGFLFMTYQELLKHPFWQRKRLEVFQRDSFSCVKCYDHLTNLQVHHLYYRYNTMPWEYPLEAFETLCELCHEKAEFIKWIQKNARNYLITDGFASPDIMAITALIERTVTRNDHAESARKYMQDIIKLIQHG